MSKSSYYFRFFENIEDRIDENYNNPKYDNITTLLNRPRYDRIVNLGDEKLLNNIVSGKTPKGIQYIGGGVPFLGSTNVLFGTIEIENASTILHEIHETKLASSQIKKDNILITMAGTIGRCAVYSHADECNANQAIAILNINKEEIEPEFLIRYLNSDLGQLFFGKLQHISSQSNINLEEIKKIKIILPKKPEQKDILNRVRLIELEAINLEDETKNINRKTGVILLKELGIEVPENETINYFFKTGEEKRTLCFSISPDEVNDRINYLFYHPRYIILNQLKEKYKVVILKECLIEPIHRGEQPEYTENGEIIVIKTVDLKNSYIDYENCLKVSQKFFEDYIEKHPEGALKKNDILIASTGYVSMGKIDVYDKDESAMASVDILVLRLKPEYDPYFVAYFLRSPLGQLQFEKWWSGSSGQIHIYEQDLNQFILPKSSEEGVPLSKQKEIATKITNKINESFELERKAKEKRQESKDTFARLILKET